MLLDVKNGFVIALCCFGCRNEQIPNHHSAHSVEPNSPVTSYDSHSAAETNMESRNVFRASDIRVEIEIKERAWLAEEKRWDFWVELTFHNSNPHVDFELDKLSACVGGSSTNWVFKLNHEGNELDYRGPMAKRAHPGPEGFAKVKAGEPFSVRVNIGQWYAIPEHGQLSIRYETNNHFSIHDVPLNSNEVGLALP